MIGIMSKLKIYLIMIAGFAAFAGVAYWYYQDTQEAMRVYAENTAKLEVALESQTLVTQQLLKDISIMKNTINQLNKDFAESRAIVAGIEGLLERGTDGRDMSIGERAIETPELIEEIINQGTVEAFGCLEMLSGKQGDYSDQKYFNCTGNTNTNGVQ